MRKLSSGVEQSDETNRERAYNQSNPHILVYLC